MLRRFLAIFVFMLTTLCVMPLGTAIAQMSSASFVIPSETVNDAGGQSSSASFIVNDSLGDVGGTNGQGSSSYLLNSGFRNMQPEPVFTFSVSSGTATLSPAPSVSVVSTASTIVTTSTNAPFGYTTTIVDDGKLISGSDNIDDVTDGTVGPVGTEEYGIALTGSDRAFTDERATATLPRTSPQTPRTIASSSTFGAGRATTVTFKMTMAAGTVNGSYSHVVTFISSPNY